MSYQKVFIRVLSYVGASSDITSTAVHHDRLLVLYSKSNAFSPRKQSMNCRTAYTTQGLINEATVLLVMNKRKKLALPRYVICAA